MPKFVTCTVLLTQGTGPWYEAVDFPVLVNGWPRDEDVARWVEREGME